MKKLILPIMKKIMMLIIFIVIASISCHRDNADNWIYSVPVTVNDGWHTASVEEVGINLQPLTSMMNFYNSREHKIHGILIVKNGKLVFEEYFPGYAFGRRSNDFKGDYVNFNWDTVHFLGFSTKSFVSALVGIAIDKNFIKNEKVTMFSYFPDYQISGYLKVKSCQKMAEYLKITKYKIQITNKFQITMSEITNSPILLDKRHHFVFLAEGV